MTTKSEIEKAAEEESVVTAIKTTSQAAFVQGYLAGARKLLELAYEHGRTTWDKEGNLYREIEIDDLRKLVEGDNPQTTGDEPV